MGFAALAAHAAARRTGGAGWHRIADAAGADRVASGAGNLCAAAGGLQAA